MQIIQTTNGQPCIIEDDHSFAVSCADFVELVLENSQMPFVLVEKFNGHRNLKIWKVSDQQLALHFRGVKNYFRFYKRGYSYSPYLNLFLEEYRTHPISTCLFRNIRTRTASGQVEAEVFNDFVLHIRQKAKQQNLKKLEWNWKSSIRKNQLRIKSVIENIYSTHDYLTAVCVNLRYHQAKFATDEIEEIVNYTRSAIDLNYYWNGGILSCPSDVAERISIDTALADKDRFLQNRRYNADAFGSLAGYIWALEYTAYAGYSVRMVLLIDQLPNEGVSTMLLKLNKLWADVTGGRGYIGQPYDKSISGLCRVLYPKEHSEFVINSLSDFMWRNGLYIPLTNSGRHKKFGAVLS